MTDIQEIYSILLARRYQEKLFEALQDKKASKGGRETLATCPLCGKPEHFSYSSEKPVWRCWHCQEAGDWLSYLERTRGLDFREALLFLAQEAGVELDGMEQDKAKYQAYQQRAELLEKAQDYFINALIDDTIRATPVLQYLLARGYSVDDIVDMELGAYVDRQGLQQQLIQTGYSEQEIRASGLLSKGFGEDYVLTFLWRDAAGRPIGIVGRPILPEEEIKARSLHKYSYSTGMEKDKGLIGLTRARGAKELLLVEGVLDALYLSSKGLKVVAIGGTSLSDAQLKAIQDNGTQELLLCLDSDEPGQKATEKAIQKLRLSKLRAYVVSLPAGYKDADELVRKAGLQPLKDSMAKAERGSSWLARWIVSQQDIKTDRGLDRALELSLEAYSGLDEPIEQKAFLSTLQQATGLSQAELAPRLEEYSQRASSRKSVQVLQSTLGRAQEKASQGDILGAELEMAQGLEALRSSRGVVAPEPYMLADLEKDISTMSEGLSSGYASLDKLFKIPSGALSIVAGRPGHGKTSLQLNMLLNMARGYKDKAFYFFSYEEAARPLAIKLIMLMAGKVLSEGFNLQAYIHYLKEQRGTDKAIDKAIQAQDTLARGNTMLLRGTDKAIDKAIQEYQELTSSGRLWLLDSRLSAEDLASTIGYLAKSSEVGAVFVDYIQKVSLQRPQQGQRYLEIKRVSELMLEQAVSLDIPIILGAQLGRSSGFDTKVRLDNLRESGDIEQDANLVLGLYNEAVDKIEEDKPDRSRQISLQVSVLKNRQGAAGLSSVLTFERPTLRIIDKEWQGGRS